MTGAIIDCTLEDSIIIREINSYEPQALRLILATPPTLYVGGSDFSCYRVARAGQYLNTLYLNTVFKYIYCIYTLYLNTFFNLYLITVFKYF